MEIKFLKKIRLPFRDDSLFSVLMLAVLVVPLFFTFYAYEKFETLKISLFLILIGAAALVFCWRLVKTKGAEYLYNPWVLYMVSGLAIWILISSLQGQSVLSGLFGNYPRFTGSAVFYFLLLVFFVFLLLSLTREKLLVILHILAIDSFVISVMGIVESFGIAFYNGLGTTGLLRPPSLLGNPDFSAMFIVGVLPIALYFLLTVEKKWQKVIYLVGLLCMVAALIIFSSRGSWLAAVVILVLSAVLYPILKAPKRFALASLSVLILGSLLFVVLLKEIKPASLSQTFTLTESNVDLRLAVWNIAGQAMSERPIFGTGPGNFIYFFQSHRGSDLSAQGSKFDDPHNLFLQLGATLGWPFLLAFLGILALAVVKAVENSRKNRDFLILTLTLSLLAFCVAACFNPVTSACYLLLIVILAGIFLPSSTIGQKRFFLSVSIPTALMGVLMIFFGVAFLSSELIFFHGYSDYLSGDYQGCLKLCGLATKINPTNQMFYSYLTASKIVTVTDYTNAEQDIKGLVALYPQDTESFVTASNLYFLMYEKTKDLSYIKKSADSVKQAIQLDPNNGSLYSHAGFYFCAMNDFDDALTYTSLGLKMQYNQDPASWIVLARVYQAQGNLRASRLAVEKAFKLQPDENAMSQLYKFSQTASDADYKKISFPIYYNPLMVE